MFPEVVFVLFDLICVFRHIILLELEKIDCFIRTASIRLKIISENMSQMLSSIN